MNLRDAIDQSTMDEYGARVAVGDPDIESKEPMYRATVFSSQAGRLNNQIMMEVRGKDGAHWVENVANHCYDLREGKAINWFPIRPLCQEPIDKEIPGVDDVPEPAPDTDTTDAGAVDQS